MPEMRRKTIVIPQAIHSTYQGYSDLLETLQCYMDKENGYSEITMNFRANIWFDANLLPIIYAYAEYGQVVYNIVSRYDNQIECSLHKLLIRNNFAKLCFKMEHRPRNNETTVPFKIFKADDTYGFGAYIDAEIIRYFPDMEERVKRDLSAYIQELFGNAQIHGDCSHVYTCGQYYPTHQKMDFTIVNLGTTIKENVVDYLTEKKENIPENCIEWAVEPEHSTKRMNSGGIGLSLMHEFILYNNGKYQIVSGNEFWELNQKSSYVKELRYKFPGTIVNIEIDQNDTNYYKYQEHQQSDCNNIF